MNEGAQGFEARCRAHHITADVNRAALGAVIEHHQAAQDDQSTLMLASSLAYGFQALFHLQRSLLLLAIDVECAAASTSVS